MRKAKGQSALMHTQYRPPILVAIVKNCRYNDNRAGLVSTSSLFHEFKIDR